MAELLEILWINLLKSQLFQNGVKTAENESAMRIVKRFAVAVSFLLRSHNLRHQLRISHRVIVAEMAKNIGMEVHLTRFGVVRQTARKRLLNGNKPTPRAKRKKAFAEIRSWELAKSSSAEQNPNFPITIPKINCKTIRLTN
ncbi:MAG TPA: hypothetical protein EYP74_03065 [Anaerolineales bacterium]|nr:hypothetical protein [Anaerolineales bacterium]